MSSPKLRSLSFSPRARQDFIDILRYTGEAWGRNQLYDYRDKIDAALQTIRRNPLLGHRRNDLPVTHLVFPVGSHIIVYRTDTESIAVVRILYQRMSFAGNIAG